MSDHCFGFASNGKVCSCGRHHGCGEWSPEHRAANYKWMSHRMPSLMNDNQRAYMADWEKHHGIISYRMDVVQRVKGKDIIGAVYIDPNAPMQLPLKAAEKPPEEPAGRKDIYG